ncbi:unnamed protein product [Prorocentrum cordatum]|uniref:Uncharacterized protein n=1 Tax=Prorocentrum cordatum TaxID=2364126 RepID=A0ABN9TKN4_9DINO|nr:unnamed protein product [Polarella glacialis]
MQPGGQLPGAVTDTSRDNGFSMPLGDAAAEEAFPMISDVFEVWGGSKHGAARRARRGRPDCVGAGGGRRGGGCRRGAPRKVLLT